MKKILTIILIISLLSGFAFSDTSVDSGQNFVSNENSKIVLDDGDTAPDEDEGQEDGPVQGCE